MGAIEPLSYNLKANTKKVVKDCDGPNQAFLACKSENTAPSACLEFGCVASHSTFLAALFFLGSSESQFHYIFCTLT